MKAHLKSHANRGRSVGTRWGPITFDAEGLATVDVESEEELQMLRHLGWLVEDSDVSMTHADKPAVTVPSGTVVTVVSSAMTSADDESAELSDHQSEPQSSHGPDTKSLHPVKPKKR